MGKIVGKNHIIAEKGVVKFSSYCINQKPEILFREETKHDYGVDGEIELTRKNEEGKIEATGEIIKVQLKSTELKGYITNETATSFDFIAKDKDLEYWQQHALPVVLIVYFVEEDMLFAKRIQKDLVLKNRRTRKISFSKTEDLLEGNDDFQNAVGQSFASRVNFDVSEDLYFNFFRVHLPPVVWEYDCLFSDVTDIFLVIEEHELSPLPKFTLIGKSLYTLEDLNRYNKTFRENILENQTGNKTITKEFILKGADERKIIVQLVNRYLGSYLYHKGIGFQKEYRRYYFLNFNETPLEVKEKENAKRETFRIEKSKGKSGRADPRAVVAKYTYYEASSFYKHLAFQLSYEWIGEKLYLIIDPKYLYTEDGNNSLENKERITRLTNKLKLSERNTQYLNHLFFIRNFLNKGEITLFYASSFDKLAIGSFEKTELILGSWKINPLLSTPLLRIQCKLNYSRIYENRIS